MQIRGKPEQLTKPELRKVADQLAHKRFGVSASRLPGSVSTAPTSEGAEARRIAFIDHYARK